MQNTRGRASLNLAILAALTLGAGSTTLHAQIVEIRETEASTCLNGRTGDNADPRSACPDEKPAAPEIRVISTQRMRPGERARMTIQQRSYEVCKGTYALSYGGPTYTGWSFPYTNAPCQWDEDRTDFATPPLQYSGWQGKQLCASWRVRNPTGKELKISWRTARLDAYRDINDGRSMVIRNNIDGVLEPGISEDTLIETCMNSEIVNGERRWPSDNGLYIKPVQPFPRSVRAPNGNAYSDLTWSYWGVVSGGWGAITASYYTETMRDWSLQSGEIAGRYSVHLVRAWIKEEATGRVVQVLN